MRHQHRHRPARFVWVYAPGALCLIALLASCDLHRGFLDIDSDDWTFRNRTDRHVDITPLYTGKDRVDHVVPRAGWEQTQFRIAPHSERTINLKTGDFPFDRILVETTLDAAWTIPVKPSPVDIVATGSPATPAQHSAKLERAAHRLKLYLVAAAIPLLWTLPILLIAELVARRRREPRLGSIKRV